MNACVRRGSGPAEQPRVVPIPVALKPAFGVVHQLRVEELPKSRIASLDLFPRRPWVIGEIEPPPILDHPVDDPAKIGLGPLDALDLTRSTQIELFVLRKGLSLVGSRESIEIGPVGRRHVVVLYGNANIVGNRLVARENSGMEFLAPMQVDRVLTVTEEETILDRRIDSRHESPHRDDLHHPLHLEPRHQSNRDPGHHAEESVPADREGEELTILGSTAHFQSSIGAEYTEGLDVRNKMWK